MSVLVIYAHDRNRVAVQGGEFDLVACGVAMHQQHRADVARAQAMLRQVAHQNDIIQFVDHIVLGFAGARGRP